MLPVNTCSAEKQTLQKFLFSLLSVRAGWRSTQKTQSNRLLWWEEGETKQNEKKKFTYNVKMKKREFCPRM